MKKQEIIDAINALLEDIALITEERCDDEIRSWLMAAMPRIWAGNKLFAEDYVEILSVFREQQYTSAQVITALECAGDGYKRDGCPDVFSKNCQ